MYRNLSFNLLPPHPLPMMGESRRQQIDDIVIFSYFPQKIDFEISCKFMQIVSLVLQKHAYSNI